MAILGLTPSCRLLSPASPPGQLPPRSPHALGDSSFHSTNRKPRIWSAGPFCYKGPEGQRLPLSEDQHQTQTPAQNPSFRHHYRPIPPELAISGVFLGITSKRPAYTNEITPGPMLIPTPEESAERTGERGSYLVVRLLVVRSNEMEQGLHSQHGCR